MRNASHVLPFMGEFSVYAKLLYTENQLWKELMGVLSLPFLIFTSFDNRIFDNILSNKYAECIDCNIELNFSSFIATVYFFFFLAFFSGWKKH